MMKLQGDTIINRWIFLILLFICSFFVNNKAIFVDIMESRNMVTAREMVYDGNWLTPTMNGELRLEKPPLPTWIAAAVEIVSPDNLALQRSMSGLAAVMLVVFTYLLAIQISKDKLYAFLTALLLCTSYNIILMGRTASWDIYCHAFMMGAIFYMFKALQYDGCRWRWFVIAGLFMGLSFLGKGPVSFYALLLPFLCSYLLFYRRSLQGKHAGCLLMMVIMLVLSSWWYLYIYAFHPEISEYVFKKESASWVNYNVRPWYYYWKFFLETGVWSLLTLCVLFVPFWKKRLNAGKSYSFTVVWMLSVLFSLSLIPEKKSRYLLPILIPAALAGANLFWYWICKIKPGDKLGKLFYRINSGLISSVIFIIPIAVYLFVYKEGQIGIAVLIFFILSLFVFGFSALLSCVHLRPYRFILTVAGLFMYMEIFMMPLIGGFVSNSDRIGLRETRKIEALNPLPFYYPATDSLRIELVYEAYKKIRKIDIDDAQSLYSAMPFVLVSSQEAEDMIPDTLQQNIIMKYYGRYDDNPWPKGHKRYKEDFIKYVTVIQKK